MTGFWYIAPCSLVEVVSEVRTASITRSMVAVRTAETSGNFDETTQRNIPEDSHLQQERLVAQEHSFMNGLPGSHGREYEEICLLGCCGV
jgi:hypothetical protein